MSATASRLPCILVVAAGLTGCGSRPPAPRTVAVSGTVQLRGQTVTGGTIQFAKEGDTTLTVTGSVRPDGSFTLQTMLLDGRKLVGAVPGRYRVTFTPPLEAGRKKSGPRAVSLREPVTVTADGENRFTLVLDKSATRS